MTIRFDDPRLDPISAEAARLGYTPREVGTGGGINAILFDSELATYSVFLGDEKTFAILRHAKRNEDDAFWSCESNCENHAFDSAADLAKTIAKFTRKPHSPRSKA